MALSHKHANMDVPISIGVILAASLSLYETITHGPHAYFDGAVMLLFFLLAVDVLTNFRFRLSAGGAAKGAK